MNIPVVRVAPAVSASRSRLLAGMPLVLMLAAAPVLQGATLVWGGGGGNADLNNPANWVSGVAPVAGDVLIFDQNLRTTLNNNLAAGTQFNGITFGLGAGSFSFSNGTVVGNGVGGNAITLAGDIINSSLNGQFINTNLGLAVAPTIHVAHRSSFIDINGAVSGAFGFTKTGAGVLYLDQQTNSFTGPITITGGTLVVSGNDRLGAPANSIVLDGGTLRANAVAATHTIALGSAIAGSGGTIDASGNFTYSGVIANNGGANSLTKTGSSTLTLNTSNTYTGNTIINQGTLSLEFNTSSPTSVINSASTLVTSGRSTFVGDIGRTLPTLNVQGTTAGARTQTFNGYTLQTGAAQISARALGATTLTLDLGAITREAGGTVAFTKYRENTAATGPAVITTTTGNDASGILGGWAVINAANTFGTGQAAPVDYAANDGAGNIINYVGYTVPSGVAPVIASNPLANVRLTSASTGSVSLAAGTTDINTLSTADPTGRTVTIGAGNTLRLGANGGVFAAAGSAGLTIGSTNVGTLTAGGAPNTAGEISFIDATSSGFAINSVIADNGTGAVRVTYSDYTSTSNSQFANITGNNTYTGGTVINSGRVQANSAAVGGQVNSFGSGAVTVLGNGQVFLGTAGIYANDFNITGTGTSFSDTPAALRLVGNQTLTGKITLLGDATISARNSGTMSTLNGQITGDYNLNLGTDQNGSNNLTLGNTSNNWTGNLVLNNQGLTLGASQVLSDGFGVGNVILNGGASINMNGNNETINALVSSSATAFVQNQLAATSSTLTVGNADHSGTFSGILRNNSGTGGTFNLTKIGAGMQTLAGTNTYTGVTRLTGGTLSVATIGNGGASGNLGAATNAAANLVFDGGTLQYTGTSASTDRSYTLNTGKTGTFDVSTSTTTLSLAGGSAGAGTLVKSGGGTLALTGANTHTGATTVTSGTLALTGAGTLNASSGVTVNGEGARFVKTSAGELTAPVTIAQGTFDATGDVSTVTVADRAGNIVTNGNGTRASAHFDTLAFEGAATIRANPLAPTTSVFTVDALVAAGAILIEAINAAWDNETYELVTYGSLTGSFNNFTLSPVANLTSRQSATLVNAANALHLTIAGDTPKWTGQASADWTTSLVGAPYNWRLITAGIGTDFLANDQVLFDDTAIGGTDINIAGANVATFGVLFNNATRDYTIGSTGGFGISAGTLTKSGLGRLAINTANSYAGGTTINAGTVVLGTATALGTGNVTLNGGTLDLNDQEVSVPTMNTAAGSTVTNDGFIGSALLTLASGNVAGVIQAGNGVGLVKTGAGTLSLTGANTYNAGTLLSAGTLQINNSASLGDTLGDLTFDGGSLQAIDNLSTAHNFRGASGKTVLIDTNGFTLTHDGVVYGSTAAGLTKSGAGTLVLNGNNAYGGATVINAGTLTLGGTNSYTGATTINAGATLRLGSANALPATALTGGGNLAGAGTFDLNGYDATFTALPGLTGAITSSAGTPTLTADLAANATQPGLYTGSLALAKSGAGILTLNAANTHTGGTILQSGGLVITNALGFGTGTLDLQGGTLAFANVNFNNPVRVSGNAVMVNTADQGNGFHSGALAGAGTLTIAQSAIVNGTTFNNVSSWKWAGDLSGFTGTFVVNTDRNVIFTNNAYDGSNARWQINGNGTASAFTGNTTGPDGIFHMGELSGSQSTAVIFAPFNSGSTLTYQIGALNTDSSYAGRVVDSGTGRAAITKVGTGSLTLSGASTYTGATAINAGTLVAANAGALGTITLGTTIASGATLDVRAAIGAEAISVGGNGVGGGGALITGSGSGTVAGPVTLTANTRVGGAGTLNLSAMVDGGFELTKVGSGTTTLGAANTYTGGTSVAAGTLAVTNANGLGTGAVSIAAAATLDVGPSFNFGTRAMINHGTLSGAATFGGVVAGAGQFSSHVTFTGGTLAPGNSAGTLSIAGNLSASSSTIIAIELAGAGSHDVLKIGGTFNPTNFQLLVSDLTGGSVLVAGNTFNLFQNASGSGLSSVTSTAFESINLPVLVTGLTWDTSALYTLGSISISASAIPEPGTYAAIFGALALLGAALRRRRQLRK